MTVTQQMPFRDRIKNYSTGVRYFFPLVLLFTHLKHNLVGLLYWLLLWAIVTDRLGGAYGIPYLFLSPEYQEDTGFWSYLLLGFSIGGLTMAFNSYSYVRIASYFPFLATVYKPFLKFCINNSLIPLIFHIIYLRAMVAFQREEEFVTTWGIVSYVLAYCIGNLLFIGISLAWFFPTNKNFYDLLGKEQKKDTGVSSRWTRVVQGRNLRYIAEGKVPLYWYVGKGFRVQQCRSTRHYSSVMLQQVFSQNRISTTIFEITTVLSYIALGLFGDKSYLDVPAGMSMVLLLTIILMLFSAMLAWMKNWTYVILIGILLSMNYLSREYGYFQFENQAYGLDYDEAMKVSYSQRTIKGACTDKRSITADSLNYLALLNAWKMRTGEEKPLMVVVNTSGGGTRSASWVFEVMRYCDSLSGGNFSKHMTLVTGASGGMIGASYYRALLLDKLNGKDVDLNDKVYFESIAEDLLNKLAFAASTNDIFFRYQSKMKMGTYNYDRGMAFEDDLNENTRGVMNHSLSYYRRPELEGRIPVIIYSPTIVNDGRRLLVSSQPLGFMTGGYEVIPGAISSYENIDVHQLFQNNRVDSLRFTSVLRMNATFPFVLPMVTLPTRPAIQLMDAGTRDNFGVKTMTQWLFAMRNWIKKNTAGVVVLQIRDTKRMLTGENIRKVTFLDKFTLPFSNVFGNFPRTQDFDQEELLKMSGFRYEFPMHFMSINLREFTKDRISLSFHLTKREKLKIKASIGSRGNKKAVRRLMGLLGN